MAPRLLPVAAILAVAAKRSTPGGRDGALVATDRPPAYRTGSSCVVRRTIRRHWSGGGASLLSSRDLHLGDQPLAKACDLAPLRSFTPAHEKISERGRRALRQGAHQASGGEIIACEAHARQRDTLS